MIHASAILALVETHIVNTPIGKIEANFSKIVNCSK